LSRKKPDSFLLGHAPSGSVTLPGLSGAKIVAHKKIPAGRSAAGILMRALKPMFYFKTIDVNG
jgi:hypothetical protein